MTDLDMTTRPDDPSAMRPRKQGSIARAVAGGLMVMVAALAAVVFLALYSFWGFDATLGQLSRQALPQIVQGSRLIGLVNQFLYQTQRLAGAETGPDRRIAYEHIRLQFDQIRELVERKEFSAKHLDKQLIVLETTLAELNELVAARIEIQGKTGEVLSQLFELAEDLIAFEQELRLGNPDQTAPQEIAQWVSKAMEIINHGGKMASENILHKIKRAEKNLKKHLADLKELSYSLPPDIGRHTEQLEARLNRLLFDENGLLPLTGSRVKIASQSAGKGNFARSLAEEFNAANATLFNGLIRQAEDNTRVLSRQVRRLVWIFSALSLGALLTAFGVFYYFRKILTSRLVNLNKAMLGRVAGRNDQIDIRGQDEISDMAQSFVYYVQEVDKRETSLKQRTSELDAALTQLQEKRKVLEKEVEDRKKAESALTQLNENLETIVAARTAELGEANVQLVAARKAAEAANQAKSDFLMNIGHELRTPMNGVMTAAEMIPACDSAEELAEIREIILSSSHSLIGLIESILDFTKAKDGVLELEQRPFFLTDVLSEVNTQFFYKGATLRLDLQFASNPEEAIPNTLVGDGERLLEILNRLVENAAKFTDADPKAVLRVRLAEPLADAGVVLQFSLTDSGIGISGSHLERIFEPFSQVDASSTRQYDGAGIGLSVCKQLVELMQGRIWAESEPQKGSTFHFTARFGVGAGKMLPPLSDLNHAKDSDLPDLAQEKADLTALAPLEAEKLFSGLRAALASFDPMAIRHQLTQIRKYRVPELDRIIERVEAYDYEHALDALKAAAKKAGINL